MTIQALPLAATAAAAASGTRMTEAEFRELYEQTARPLKVYLYRLTSNAALADDLLQEAYFRMLRVELPPLDATGRKNYLYRVATNLVRDHFRSARRHETPLVERDFASPERLGARVQLAGDIQQVLDQVKPRERELMWLAYVEGVSHRDIASITGLKENSIRPLLFRIRQRLADLLRARGLGERQ